MTICHMSQETVFLPLLDLCCRGSSLCYFQWFKDNEMKANADKCHVLLIQAMTSDVIE